MAINLIDIDFKKAEAILSDALFKVSFSKDSLSDLKKIKLLKARNENIDFEAGLAEMICGDNTHFPYRSSYYMTKFFEDLGLNFSHDRTTRRVWMKGILEQLDIQQISYVIEKGLFRKKDFKNPKLRTSNHENIDDETLFLNAVKEFKTFINECITINDAIDLAAILDLNLNIELLFDRTASTKDSELNDLIEEAKTRFLNPNDKQVAIEKLWDAFERIKTYYGANKKESADKLIVQISNELDKSFFENEFHKFTAIGNNYRIRHHETNKKEIRDTLNINYLFFSLLCLIDLCLNHLNEDRL